jgi:hypothetical protein
MSIGRSDFEQKSALFIPKAYSHTSSGGKRPIEKEVLGKHLFFVGLRTVAAAQFLHKDTYSKKIFLKNLCKMLDKLSQKVYNRSTKRREIMTVTYLVETWRNQPYKEVLEDTFDFKKDAIDFAKATANLQGVEMTKVFKLEVEDKGLYTKETLEKLKEFC